MEDYNGLKKELLECEWKPVSFGIYNYIDDNGVVVELNGLDRKSYDMDDFEFHRFNLTEKEKLQIQYNSQQLISILEGFKEYIEKELQPNIPRLRIYWVESTGALFAVKLKSFDIKTLGIEVN